MISAIKQQLLFGGVAILLGSPFHPDVLLAQSQKPRYFLVVKIGDAAATQDLAAEYLGTIADYFRSKIAFLEERPLKGLIANDVDSAAAILQATGPVLAYVPAGFYLNHFYSQKSTATPIVQTPRFGKTVEKYYIVTQKNGPSTIRALRGKGVRCAFSVDLPYLQKVVFPKDHQPGVHFRLEASENLADDIFLMVESQSEELSEADVPSAILLDEELKNFFEVDDFVWPELKVIWQSEELPRELFVALGDDWTDADRNTLSETLLKMKDDPVGSQMLNLLQSAGFEEVDRTLLEKTARKYFSSN